MSITIYANDKTTLKLTVDAVLSSSLHQSLNGECTFNLSMPGTRLPGVDLGDELRLGDLYFDITRISRASQTAGALFSLSCEHISYVLADANMPEGEITGTPAAGLAAILSGTGLSAGTVDVSGTFSMAVKEGTSRRDALQKWASKCGAEISYTARQVNLLGHVGSSVAVNLSETENVKSLTVNLDRRSTAANYSVELSRLQQLGIGDELMISYNSLEIWRLTRILSLDYDPFHPMAVRMTCGRLLPTYYEQNSLDMSRRVGLNTPYYGVTISRQNGLEIKRSDGASEAIFNSDRFEMDALIDGTMQPRIYFDPIRGDYVFNGALGADAIFTDSLYAELGFVAELTVDRLTTSRRVRKYLLQDTSDDNYIQIQDHYQRFITGSVISADVLDTEAGQHLLAQNSLYMAVEPPNDSYLVVQVTNRYGQRLYWQREIVSVTADGYPLDENNRQIYATTEVTDWPVLSYAYAEQVKAEYAFAQDGQYYVPQIVLGAGDGHGNSRGYIYKRQTDLLMRYVTTNGKNVDIQFSDEGYVDALHRRLSYLHIMREQVGTGGTIYYQVEGNDTMHTLEFVEIDGVIRYTWPDGHVCEVSVE